jgi:hypothetical protein
MRNYFPGFQSMAKKTLISGSLIKTALFFAACFPANGEMRVADSPRRLDIQVQANEFGNVSSHDISAVLQSSAGEIWRHCPRTRLPGIDVYHRTDHPQTDFKRTPSGRIAIGLTAADTHWAQFAFQFGHEFCHTLANYANDPRQLRGKPLRNGFFVHFTRHEPFLADHTSLPLLEKLRSMAKSVC